MAAVFSLPMITAPPGGARVEAANMTASKGPQSERETPASNVSQSYVHSRLLCEPERMLHTRVLNQFALAQALSKRSGPGHKEATCTFHIYFTKRSKPE